MWFILYIYIATDVSLHIKLSLWCLIGRLIADISALQIPNDSEYIMHSKNNNFSHFEMLWGSSYKVNIFQADCNQGRINITLLN